ncbi:MAG: hypothetical protein WC756_14870 [Taibaiella sp.]|jgi:hypothetical protein
MTKTQNVTNINAKAFASKCFLAITLIAGITLSSCKKDEATTQAEVTQEDAADAIESSLVNSTYGLTASVTESSAYAAGAGIYVTTSSLECGHLYSNTYSSSGNTGSYSHNYTINRNYQLNCDEAGNHQSFVYNFDMNGTYETPRMSSDDSATSSWSITGLSPSSTFAIFNGSYQRNGSQHSKVRNMRSFTSVINYTLNSLTVNKSTHTITSGSASVSINASSGSNNYTYIGSITFNGNGTATLLLNGTTYTIIL